MLPDIKAAELGEALRSLGLVLTQKELSDMKVPWPMPSADHSGPHDLRDTLRQRLVVT